MGNESPAFTVFAHSEERTLLAAGETLFRQGDASGPMYAVQSGSVEIRVNGVVVETVREGGIFGEMGLIDEGPRTSDAVAASAATLAVVNQTQFMLMVRQTPFFAVQVMRLLVHRLRATDALIGRA